MQIIKWELKLGEEVYTIRKDKDRPTFTINIKSNPARMDLLGMMLENSGIIQEYHWRRNSKLCIKLNLEAYGNRESGYMYHLFSLGFNIGVTIKLIYDINYGLANVNEHNA